MKIISYDCVLKIFFNIIGQVEKNKAQLVEKVFSQVQEINFSDIFSHVAKLTSITLVMSQVVAFDIMI